MEATLATVRHTAAPRARSRWPGRILTTIPAAFLAFDAAIKVVHVQAVTEGSARLGLPDHLAPTLGVVLAACVALFVIPRTAVLGAVVLTGYLGGAVAMHVRIGDPLATHVLFPIYVGVLLWAGLYLRDPRVRALVRAPGARGG